MEIQSQPANSPSPAATTESHIRARLQNSFARQAGYLPQAERITEWVRSQRQAIARSSSQERTQFSSSVRQLQELCSQDAVVRMYLSEMIAQVPDPYRAIESTDQLFEILNNVVRTAPAYNSDRDWHNFFPVSALFVFMMMTTAGEALFRYPPFNTSLRAVLQEWCAFLDSKESTYVLNTGETGWLSPSAIEYGRLSDYIIPDASAPAWGWPSFNAYFHRQVKPERRPISAPGDPRIIVSANDGTVYRIARDVAAIDQFWAKGQPFSLTDMLNRQDLDPFVGGDVLQSFLGGSDYHRWHAPIDGVVREVRLIPGLMFSEAESAGSDPSAGTFSQSYATSVNTRGLVFIESNEPSIGVVCLIAIGMAEVSSITIRARVGDTLKKGDEVGYFSYGGSSVVLIFQREAIDHFTVAPPPPHNPWEGQRIAANAQIAVARDGRRN